VNVVPVNTVLAAREVGFAYRPGVPVLTGASIDVVAGRRLAVLGPNGGGKTTLFRLLAGALRPASGAILLDGAPVCHDRRGLGVLRRTVQLVLQDPDDQLFAASVAQDVSFGPTNMGLPRAEVRARTAAALDDLGIADLADRPTHELSFGQRKRTTIAGAVAMRPRVLVLDEPTAGLDPAGVEALLATLAELHADGTTVVVSTHDVDLAFRWADEVALVADGRVRTGDPDTVLGDPALLAAARLGPAWAPAVQRLLDVLDLDGPSGPGGRGPRTATELDAVLRALRVGAE
jgi:cobalt/nickel transport system ATP-binding protein